MGETFIREKNEKTGQKKNPHLGKKVKNRGAIFRRIWSSID